MKRTAALVTFLSLIFLLSPALPSSATSPGTVWAWGSNSHGNLGDGTNTNRYTPVQVSGMTGVVAVAGGDSHSLALKNDGTVWAWGLNAYGQLGDGTTTDRLTPVQVSGMTGVVAVAGSDGQSLALKNDVPSGHGDGTCTASWATVRLPTDGRPCRSPA